MKIKKKNEQTKKLLTEKKQTNLNEKLEKCSIEIKSKLNTLSELSNVQYNTELTTYINKVKLDEKLKICSKKIEEKLNSLINTLDNINVPNVSKKRGGSNFEITNDIIQKLNLVNVSKSEDYTGKLKNIKQIYEKGLKENIEQYKKICKALTNYIKDLQQIIKGLLSSFIDGKKKFIEEKKRIFEETTKEINEIINKKIKEKGSEKGSEIDTINISTTRNNKHLRDLLEAIILDDTINENTNYDIKEKLMNYVQLNVILNLIGQTNTNTNTKNNRNNKETYHGLTTSEANELILPIIEVLIGHKKKLKDLYTDNIYFI